MRPARDPGSASRGPPGRNYSSGRCSWATSTTTTSTWWSSARASAGRSRPTSWRHAGFASACSNAARPFRRDRSPGRRRRWRTTCGTRAKACTGCSTCGRSRGSTRSTASGLGGGSLIYANVMLRKDPSWFVQHHPYRKNVIEEWPISYETSNRTTRAVEKFLDVQTFPDGADIPKAAALRDAARQIGMARRVPQGTAGRPIRRSGWHLQPGRAAGEQRVPEHLRRRREGTPDVPALRRVRCRMQRRGEEHARSHLRVGGRPPRCGDLDPVGGDRAAPSDRRLRGRVHRAPSRTGRAQDRHRRVVAACSSDASCRRRRGRDRFDLSPPSQPGVTRHRLSRARHTLLRERRSPRIHPQVRARRRAVPARRIEGSRHLVVHPLAGQRRHELARGFRDVPRGRRLPGVHAVVGRVDAVECDRASHRDLHVRAHQGTLHRSAQVAALGRALAAAR